MRYSDITYPSDIVEIIKEQTKDCVWIDDEHTRTTIWEKFEKIGLWFILIVFILCYV